MNKTTHVLGGVALAAVPVLIPNDIVTVDGIVQIALLTSGAALGAILPDIDKKNTAISNKHPFISFIVRLFCTHRGFTHSLLALALVSAAVLLGLKYIIPNEWYSPGTVAADGIILGYASHLILDALNPDGIPLFYPLGWKFHLASIRTGKIGEMVVRLLLVVCVIAEVYLLIGQAGIGVKISGLENLEPVRRVTGLIENVLKMVKR